MFDELIRLWNTYMEAQTAEPYNPEIVQGRGMAFAQEWTARKEDICKHLSVDEKDFSYVKTRAYMALIIRSADAATV